MKKSVLLTRLKMNQQNAFFSLSGDEKHRSSVKLRYKLFCIDMINRAVIFSLDADVVMK